MIESAELMKTFQPRHRPIGLFVAALSLFCVSPLIAEEMPRIDDVRPLLQFEDRTEGPEQHFADVALMTELFDYADSKDVNVFELFAVVVPVLEEQQVRLLILGSTLRRVTESFRVGGDRAQALLPIPKVRYIELGAAIVPDDDLTVEIFLTEEHQQYLEIANITLGTHYGFADVEGRAFTGGFGAGVRRIGFNFNLDSIDLYELNKVAIYVRNFARPKRWRIYDIERK